MEKGVTSVLLNALGGLLRWTPEPLLQGLCWLLGGVIRRLPRRRFVLASNVDHAFPQRSRAWKEAVVRTHCRRLVEMGLFTLVMGRWSEATLRERLSFSAGAAELLSRDKRPVVVMPMHTTLLEFMSAIPLCGAADRPYATLFRPLNQPGANAWLAHQRARFGVAQLSRRDGLAKAFGYLRQGAFVGVLYDQNTRHSGMLTLLCNRLAATTDLPGLMVRKYGARAVVAAVVRTGFMRARMEFTPLPDTRDPAELTFAANAVLEQYLQRDDPAAVADWLWAHNRWRTCYHPHERLRLVHKKNLLDEHLAWLGRQALPRRLRLFIWLSDARTEAALWLPLLAPIRVSRPDAAITLVGPADVLAIFAEHATAPELLDRGARDYRQRLKTAYPDVCLLPQREADHEAEARRTGCRERYGWALPGERRDLREVYEAPAERDPHTRLLGLLVRFGLDPATLPDDFRAQVPTDAAVTQSDD